MSKKMKLTVVDRYWIDKLLSDEIKHAKMTIELYPNPSRSWIEKEVKTCREKLAAYEKLAAFVAERTKLC